MRTKGILATFLVALVLLVAVVYLVSKDQPIPETVTIAVSRTPLSTPFYVAQQQGLFEQAGINVKLKEVIGGYQGFKSLTNGDSELATCSDSVIVFNSFQRSDFSILATFVQSDNDIKIISKYRSGNLSARDLEQQPLAVVKDSASEYFLHTFLMIEGADPGKVDGVHIPPEKMLEALREDKVSAVSIWEPYAFEIIQALDKSVVVYPTKGLYSLTFNLVGSKNYVQQHPEQIRRILSALEQAHRIILEQPELSKQIIKQQLQLDDAFIEWIWPDYLFHLSLDQSLISTLESQARWAIENRIVEADSPPDYRQLLDPGPLIQVDPWASTL